MTNLLKKFNTELGMLQRNTSDFIDPKYAEISKNICINPVWRFRMIEVFLNEMQPSKNLCMRINTEIDRCGHIMKYLDALPSLLSNHMKKEKSSEVELEEARMVAINTFDSFLPFIGEVSERGKKKIYDNLFAENTRDLLDDSDVVIEKAIVDDEPDALSVGQKIVERYKKNLTKAVDSHIASVDETKVMYFLMNADSAFVLDSSDMFVPAWIDKNLKDFKTCVLDTSSEFPERFKTFNEFYESRMSEEKKENGHPSNIVLYANRLRFEIITCAMASTNEILETIYRKLNPNE